MPRMDSVVPVLGGMLARVPIGVVFCYTGVFFFLFFFFGNKLTLAFNVGAQTTAGVIIPATSGDPSQLVSHVCGQWDIVSAARAALALVKTTAKEFTFDDGATKSMHTSFCASDAASWVVPRLRLGNRSAPQERPHERDAERTG